MKRTVILTAAALWLSCGLNSYAGEVKPFVSKDHQFKVKSNVPLESWSSKGFNSFKTPNDLTAANNSYAVLVLTGKDFNSRYGTYKFMLNHHFFGSKPMLKETSFAGHPSLDFEALTNTGFPCVGKIVNTPSKTYVVLGAGHETAATRDFVQSFQLTAANQASCNGKCDSGCKAKCDEKCQQSCSNKTKSECTEAGCKR